MFELRYRSGRYTLEVRVDVTFVGTIIQVLILAGELLNNFL